MCGVSEGLATAGVYASGLVNPMVFQPVLQRTLPPGQLVWNLKQQLGIQHHFVL